MGLKSTLLPYFLLTRRNSNPKTFVKFPQMLETRWQQQWTHNRGKQTLSLVFIREFFDFLNFFSITKSYNWIQNSHNYLAWAACARPRGYSRNQKLCSQASNTQKFRIFFCFVTNLVPIVLPYPNGERPWSGLATCPLNFRRLQTNTWRDGRESEIFVSSVPVWKSHNFPFEHF